MSSEVSTAPQRLGLLLPWLNRAFDEHLFRGRNPEPIAVRTDHAAIRHTIADFLKSFDGSAGAGYLVVAEPTDTVQALDDDAIGKLEAVLLTLLEQGFGDPTLQGDVFTLPLSSVRVAVRPITRRRPVWRTTPSGRPVLAGGAKARADYQAAGAYGLRVQGPIRELVPFVFMHLLMQQGMVAVKRCARRDQPPWADCPHLFIDEPGRRGPPKRFCSRSCGLRYGEQQDQAKARHTGKQSRKKR